MPFSVTLHKGKGMFTVTFAIIAVTQFINIRNFTSLFLNNATCYTIIVATFWFGDLNSI